MKKKRSRTSDVIARAKHVPSSIGGPEYRREFRGRLIHLHKVATARIVYPSKNDHIMSVAARLVQSGRLAIDTEVPNSVLMVRGDRDKLSELDTYEDVKLTRGVLADDRGSEYGLLDELIIRFKPRTSQRNARRLLERLHCYPKHVDGSTYLVGVPAGSDDVLLAIAAEFAGLPEVVFAEPNYLSPAPVDAVAPDQEPLFANQWYCRNTGQQNGIAGADINVDGAWAITMGSPKIKIAILDSGVQTGHPDLQAAIAIESWDFDNADNDPTNLSDGHGTRCAGVISAAMNGRGIIGVAPLCKLVALRATGSKPTSAWAETIRYAGTHASILSASRALPETECLATAITDVVTTARGGRGLVCVFSAGNRAESVVNFPARLDEVIAVGATTHTDRRAAYSNYGQGIDLLAPGGDTTFGIETTDLSSTAVFDPPAGYAQAGPPGRFFGTSAATPIVAGIAGLMLSVNPHLSARDVKQILCRTAQKIDPENARYDATGYSKTHGFGRVDAGRAVAEAKKMSL